MKPFLILICSLAMLTTKAQKIRFTDMTNHWEFACVNDPTPPNYIYEEHFAYSGTDTAAGHTYHKMPGGWVREDTIARKVYARKAIPADTTEKLLYDYNLNTGDTFHVSYNGNKIYCIITSVDSTKMNNVWHKVQHFGMVKDSLGPAYIGFTVIEGLGCTHHPFYPLMAMNIEAICEFGCFYNATSHPIPSPQVGAFNNTSSCALSVGSAATENKIAIAPNPGNKEAALLFNKNISEGKITIYNAMGRIVWTDALHGRYSIPIGAQLHIPGCYWVTVTGHSGLTLFNGKFIYQ